MNENGGSSRFYLSSERLFFVKTLPYFTMMDDCESAKDLYEWNESVFTLMGVWPLRSTYITFVSWITYLLIHLSMEFVDLYGVSGNLELMILNLSESTLETMILVKMMVLRFSVRLVSLMRRIIDDLDADNYESMAEKEIYMNYNRIAKSFFKLWLTMGVSASIVYHMKPLELRLKSVILNETLPFVLPYRTRLYFDVNDSTTFWLVWIVQSPMICIHMFHSVTIGYLFSLVLHVCGKLSVLVFRIKNLDLTAHGDAESSKMVFRDILSRHQIILRMAKDIERVFQLVLLEELLISTVIIGLVSYRVISNVDTDDKGVFLASLLYVSTILLLIYGYCVAGEYLITESRNLYDAYYQCEWYDVSDSFKKQMIICMIGAKKPIQLSGGGYYVFSLISFTGVLKSTASYISMLRKISQ